jgi:hypothetical protein
MAQADIEMWVDNVKDTIDDRSGLSLEDQLEALRELIQYIEITSISDVKALQKQVTDRTRPKRIRREGSK